MGFLKMIFDNYNPGRMSHQYVSLHESLNIFISTFIKKYIHRCPGLKYIPIGKVYC